MRHFFNRVVRTDRLESTEIAGQVIQWRLPEASYQNIEFGKTPDAQSSALN